MERPPMNIFFSSFFSVTRDQIDHFGEEIVWLPFISQIYLITPYYIGILALHATIEG